MNNLLPLMQREWLQHRFAWALLVLVPVLLALLLLGAGPIELDDDMTAMQPSHLALLLAMMTIGITTAVLFLLLGATSLFVALGSPRRDHGDRSIEFWLSLPSGHAESLLAPMLVHLLLVPAAALLVGFAVSLPVSMVVVGRVVGSAEWFALPWGQILTALPALLLRVLAGLPMALLWLSPLLMAAMLANALARRWGLPLLVIGLTLISAGLERVFKAPLMANALDVLFMRAGTSLLGAGQGMRFGPDRAPRDVLPEVPAAVMADFVAAVQNLAHPVLPGALVLTGLLFAGLLAWRRRGAALG